MLLLSCCAETRWRKPTFVCFFLYKWCMFEMSVFPLEMSHAKKKQKKNLNKHLTFLRPTLDSCLTPTCLLCVCVCVFFSFSSHVRFWHEPVFVSSRRTADMNLWNVTWEKRHTQTEAAAAAWQIQIQTGSKHLKQSWQIYRYSEATLPELHVRADLADASGLPLSTKIVCVTLFLVCCSDTVLGNLWSSSLK